MFVRDIFMWIDGIERKIIQCNILVSFLCLSSVYQRKAENEKHG